MLGGPQRAVAVHVSAEVLPGRDPRAAIEAFVAALGPIDVLADPQRRHARAEPAGDFGRAELVEAVRFLSIEARDDRVGT